jgi:malonyl-CoA decarboxylase
MNMLADLITTLFDRKFSPTSVRDNRKMRELLRDLTVESSEMSALNLARQILARYSEADAVQIHAFFSTLAAEFDLEPSDVSAALKAYSENSDKSSYRAFAYAAEPPRQEIVRRLNQVPGATALLVRMRADLLNVLKSDPTLGPVDEDFQHLFKSWFNRGFLVLRPITWQSPANILEKIIEYEAVHAIHNWDALRARLAPDDRRCFAFFHPAMPDEPLIFVEVALTKGIPGSIQDLLSTDREALSLNQINSAVFYSISNCQKGLAGISFGNSLIKQVAIQLTQEIPNLSSFVTLSPIPGLANWMDAQGLSDDLSNAELRALAAHYLVNAKGKSNRPLDHVERFHLNNGAMVYDIHPRGDLSLKGSTQSRSTMVNYLYEMTRVAENHEQFAAKGHVTATKSVMSAARKGRALLFSLKET